MRCHSDLYDVAWQSCRHHRNSCFFFAGFWRILFLQMLITFERHIVQSWLTLHFAQNSLLFHVAILRKVYVNIFWDLKFLENGFQKDSVRNLHSTGEHIVYSIENFKGYPNHYLDFIWLLVFTEQFQRQWFLTKILNLHFFKYMVFCASGLLIIKIRFATAASDREWRSGKEKLEKSWNRRSRGAKRWFSKIHVFEGALQKPYFVKPVSVVSKFGQRQLVEN